MKRFGQDYLIGGTIVEKTKVTVKFGNHKNNSPAHYVYLVNNLRKI